MICYKGSKLMRYSTRTKISTFAKLAIPRFQEQHARSSSQACLKHHYSWPSVGFTTIATLKGKKNYARQYRLRKASRSMEQSTSLMVWWSTPDEARTPATITLLCYNKAGGVKTIDGFYAMTPLYQSSMAKTGRNSTSSHMWTNL